MHLKLTKKKIILSIFNINTKLTHLSKNLTNLMTIKRGLRIKITLSSTLSNSLGLSKTSLGLSKTSLGLSSRSLSFSERDASTEGLDLKITKRINSQAVGISTGGLSKIVLNTRPNLLKKSLTLRDISFSKGLSEFCVDFIEFHTESLRQSVRFRYGLRKLEQRILIGLALSFSKSLDTLSILEGNIGVSIFHLTVKHSILDD